MKQLQVERLSPSMARSPLLIVDDNPKHVEVLERVLTWGGFLNVQSTNSAAEAFRRLDATPHLLILDLMGPGSDGCDFLAKVRERYLDPTFLPVMVFSGDASPETKIRCLELGASDFLTKPGDAFEIQLKIRNLLKLRELHFQLQNHNQILEAKVEQRTVELVEARREAVELLGRISEYRDDDTGGHVSRVGSLSAAMARRLEGEDSDLAKSLALVAPLHDIGKIAIPDEILRKPGQLSPEELTTMRSHVLVGAQILKEVKSPLLELAKEIVAFHHEKWDGSGYPQGLSGERIPLSARIVAVADAYDAMTNDRFYRKASSREDALAVLQADSGTHFDPAVIAAIHQIFGVPLQKKTLAA